MSYGKVFWSILLAMGAAIDCGAQTCAGPSTGLPPIGQQTNPPAQSGTIDVSYSGTFSVTRSGIYVIKGTVSLGRGAGAPVDITWVKATVAGRTVIEETPPPIAGTPPPLNGWTYHWSIYYWTIGKNYEVRTFLAANTQYSVTVAAKGSYQVVTPYHRRNYGVSMNGQAIYCGPPAAVQSVGAGCVGPGAPTLQSPMTPVLGQRRDLLVTGRPSALGAVALGIPATSPLYLGAGCSIWVDVAGPVAALSLAMSSAGTGYVVFPIPASPALAGLRVASQAFLISPSSPIGMDLTNGLVLTLGY